MKHGASRNKASARDRRQASTNCVEASSGNVFADLGLSNPEGLLARAELVRKISAIIQLRKLTQTEAAILLGIDQPKVSALLRGKLQGFSTDRLFRFLNALGSDVEIVVRKPRKKSTPARTRVLTAR